MTEDAADKLPEYDRWFRRTYPHIVMIRRGLRSDKGPLFYWNTPHTFPRYHDSWVTIVIREDNRLSG